MLGKEDQHLWRIAHDRGLRDKLPNRCGGLADNVMAQGTEVGRYSFGSWLTVAHPDHPTTLLRRPVHWPVIDRPLSLTTRRFENILSTTLIERLYRLQRHGKGFNAFHNAANDTATVWTGDQSLQSNVALLR